MKTKIFLWINFAIFLSYGVGMAEPPHQVGGFVLGENIRDYREMVIMESELPIRHQEYLHELEIRDMEDFRSGAIWVGNCLDPGRIIRVKLKYFDSSKEFYKSLLSRFKKRFGEPSEWRGDPFHIVIAWKWSFIDNKKNRISLILQHNTKDREEKIGNAVKLTMTNLIEEERLCHEKRSSASPKNSKMQKHATKGPDSINWDRLIPR